MNAVPSSLADLRLVVTGQAGLVARSGPRLLVIPRLSTATSRQSEQLLQLCLDETTVDSTLLLRRAAYLLTDPTASTTPGFCLLVPESDHVTRLLVHGAVKVEVPSEPSTLSGLDHVTWIEHRVADLNGLRVFAADEPPVPGDSASSWLDLRDGVVAGSTVSLQPVERRQAPGGPLPARRDPSTPPTPVRSAAAGRVDLRQAPLHPRRVTAAAPGAVAPADKAIGEAPPPPSTTAPADPTTRRHPIPGPPSFEAVLLSPEPGVEHAPLPTADQPDVDLSQVFVEGIVCARGHFNDPDAAYCTVCGISMVQRTHEFVSGVRPPLGVLLFDDGSAFTIDGNYVLGREPEFDPAVAEGSARPLTLSDPENAVSRVHAELRLQGWRVLLVDRGSANGTLVSGAGDDDWHQLEPGEPLELVPGQHLRFGDRDAVYESHVRQR